MEAGARVRTAEGAEGTIEQLRSRDARVQLDNGQVVTRRFARCHGVQFYSQPPVPRHPSESRPVRLTTPKSGSRNYWPKIILLVEALKIFLAKWKGS